MSYVKKNDKTQNLTSPTTKEHTYTKWIQNCEKQVLFVDAKGLFRNQLTDFWSGGR